MSSPDLDLIDHIDLVLFISSPDLDLIDHIDGGPMENTSGVELEDVGLDANLEQMLQNESWAHDAV